MRACVYEEGCDASALAGSGEKEGRELICGDGVLGGHCGISVVRGSYPRINIQLCGGLYGYISFAR